MEHSLYTFNEDSFKWIEFVRVFSNLGFFLQNKFCFQLFSNCISHANTHTLTNCTQTMEIANKSVYTIFIEPVGRLFGYVFVVISKLTLKLIRKMMCNSFLCANKRKAIVFCLHWGLYLTMTEIYVTQTWFIYATASSCNISVDQTIRYQTG